MKKFVVILACVCCAAAAQALDLDGYLGQVCEKNDAVRGALSASAGSQARSDEGSLIFSPRLFSDVTTMDDKRETLMPATQGTETVYSQGEVGVSQVTRFGLAGRVYYGIYNTELVNASRVYLPRTKFSDSALTLELSQPLWQNAGGSQYRNGERAVSSQAKAGMYAKRYEAQMLLMGAEVKYWKLSAARASIAVLMETLERTKGILEFNRKKVNRGLADPGDVLQAEAMLQARNLDLVKARGEERQAAREFNAMRTMDSDVVDDEVRLPPFEDVQKLLSELPQRAQSRNDVLAAECGMQAATAAGEISGDKTRPDVNIYAVTSLNNRGDDISGAVQDTLNNDHPYYVAGLKLSVPLEFGRTSSVRSGYSREVAGARLQYKQKKSDQEAEWKNLMNSMQDCREALLAADALQKAQFAKLDNERNRQKDGRSTMFQVFAFEQEYLASQINIISLSARAMSLLAQARTFDELPAVDINRGGK